MRMTCPPRLRHAFALAALCLSPAPALAEQAPRVRTVAAGTNIDWSYVQGSAPARYQSGPVTLTLQGRPDADSPDLIQPVLTVEMPGLAPVQVQGSLTPASVEHRVTVGQWDSERPFVLFQSFSGGAHCCNEVHVVVPENGRLRATSLGEWDGGYDDRLPTDVDGDGRIDFVFIDSSFLYAFASYAESFAPPAVFNVVDGAAVDVSARPGFRPLFERALAQERQGCLHPRDMSPNGACAAYAASAARLGRFNEAWAEVLRAYDRTSEWTLPTACSVALADSACPEGATVTFDNYPDALRHLLVELGYLER